MSVALTGRFARNGGYGSIEESEILNLSSIAEGFGVISGRHVNFYTERLHKSRLEHSALARFPPPFAPRHGQIMMGQYEERAGLVGTHTVCHLEGGQLERRRHGQGGAETMRQKADRAKRSRGGKGSCHARKF